MEASRGRGEGSCAAVSKKPTAPSVKSAFSSPPRFAGALKGGYAKLFGGLISSCSIPFLDLPPAGDGFDGPPAGSKRPGFDYSEVFGGLDLGEFAATYEELLAESKTEAAVDASDGRVRKESNLQQQATELQLEHPNGNHVPCPEDDQLPLNSNHSDGDSKHLNPSYNKAPKESNLWQQATEAFELPLEHPNGNRVACSEDKLSSNSNSSDGDSKHLNSSHNELSTGFKDYAISGIIEPHAVQGFNSIVLESKPLDTEKGGNLHCVLHEEINDEKQRDKTFMTYSSDGSRISSDDVTTDWKQTRSQYLFPENDHASMKRESCPSSSHSVSSGNTSSYDITYVSVSEVNLQTRPSLMPPPSRPPPKMFNKQVHPIVKVHTMSDQLEGGICKLISNHEKLPTGFISERHIDQEVVKESSPFSFDVDSTSAVSAVAMKETTQLAQGRLQSSKVIMERKCDNFHSSKKMDHSANVQHEERVADQASGITEISGQILIKKNMVNELKQSGMNLREESTGKFSVDTSPNLKKIEHVVLPGEHEQMMALNGLESTKLGSQAEKESDKLKVNRDRVEMEPEKWKVNKEYYKLAHTEKKLSKVSEIPEQEAFRNKLDQTLKLSEENKRENSEVAEVLKFENNTRWNSANEGNQKEKDAESMSDDAINFVEKRVGVIPEQEAFRNKIKQTLKLSEANKRENSEAAEALEFVNNTQWNNANEENQKEENTESMKNDAIKFIEKRVGVTSEKEAFRNKIKQTLKLSEENKRENLEAAELSEENKRGNLEAAELSEENKRENFEAAEVLEFENDTQWNSANEGSQNQENVKSMRYNAVNFVEKRVGITSEQEAFMNKIKQTELSEENKKENLKVADVLDFENNTQLSDANEGSRKEENVGSLRNDAINFVEKGVGVTPDMVPEALVHDNVINLEEIRAYHGEKNKIEEVQGVPGEGVNVPHAGEYSSAFLEKREVANDSVPLLNHGSIHVEEKSLDAKEIFECGQHSYAFKTIHNNEVDELKSETARDEHIVSEVTYKPYEVEETLDCTPRTPVLDENEIKLLDEYVEVIGGDGTEATYAYRDSEKAVREEQAKSNQSENETLRENIDAALEQEDNKHLKQESCIVVENDSRFEIDQEQNYLEEVYKKLKAAQEAAMNEEPEKLVKATKNTWHEENNAEGTQVECHGNDRKQQSTQVPHTLGTSKEPSVSLNSNEVTKDKDAEEVHLKPDVFGKSPILNTPQEFFLRPSNTDFNVQQANLLGRRTNIVDSIQDGIQRQHMASEKCMHINKVDDSELLQKEKEQADEQAKQLEEKEREREKDRVAVERATRETHERALADAWERAQRIAVERVTAEARQRALKEAREKAEFEKATKEARLRAERAAVERATAEARERAAERARAEKAAADAKDRAERFNNTFKDRNGSHNTQFQKTGLNFQGYSVSEEGESALRCKARLERHQRTAERAAKALAEKNRRDILAQREQAERDRLAEYLNAEVKRWSTGKEGNLRALLSTLQYILATESGWQPIPMQEVVTAAAVKKAYRKATLFVHPDKLQQRGASIQQKYICEKVFDLLKEAWNRFNSEERW